MDMPDDTLNFDDTIPGSSGTPSEADLPEGSLIGQYRVVRLIGRGGMGQVYEVEHTVLDKSFALKLLPGHLARRPDALARFQREAKVMANLEHEHILLVDDFGEHAGRYFLRMPLVRGVDLAPLGLQGNAVTLQDLADAGGGRVDQALLADLLGQVLEALSYAHAQGAVHRDIKPANILLEPGRTRSPLHIRITDFGLVRIVGEDWLRSQADLSVRESLSLGDLQTIIPSLTQQGSSTRALLGTYAFMSPEQKRGQQADYASDLYAIGLIAFRFLTGLDEMAFDLPSDVDDALAPEWDAWIRQAVRPQKEKRFASAAEMGVGLRGISIAIGARAEAAARAEQERERRQAEAARRERERQERVRAEQIEKRRRADAVARQRERRLRAAAKDTNAAPAQRRSLLQPRGCVTVLAKTFGCMAVLTWAGIAVMLLLIIWILDDPVEDRLIVTSEPPTRPMHRPVPTADPAKVFTTSTRNVDIATPQGKSQKEITYHTNALGMEFVRIPTGKFKMGSTEGYGDEKPVHEVTITKAFYLSATEVTQAQYKTVTGQSPSRFTSDTNPVERVSWNDAVAFCKALSKRDGVPYRLPTEAEWEYSCRAGTTTPFYTGATISTDLANYDGNYTYGDGQKGVYRAKTTPVASFPANSWGLYDMHGNVYEWCQDWYNNAHYAKSAAQDPKGPNAGSSRVLRGGSWYVDPSYCPSAGRGGSSPTYAVTRGGFRIVAVIAPR